MQDLTPYRHIDQSFRHTFHDGRTDCEGWSMLPLEAEHAPILQTNEVEAKPPCGDGLRQGQAGPPQAVPC